MKTMLTGILLLSLASSLMAADGAPEKKNIRVCIAPYGPSNWVAVRFDSKTGKSWRMQDDNWAEIPDKDSIQPGEYEVYIVGSGQAGQDNWNCLRINHVTGETWRMNSGKWTAMHLLANE